MSTLRVNKSISRLLWCTACGSLAVAMLIGAQAGRAQDKKNPPRWTVVKVEFKGPGTIADPPAPGKKVVQPKPKVQFEFDEKGGRAVKPGEEKETPYITISHVPNYSPPADEFKVIDGLGQALASPSQYYVGKGNADVLVFKRDNWKRFGELYLAGPGDQKIALSKFLPAEDQAAWKSTTAKILAKGDETDKAKELCQQIVKQFAKTKSAKEARQLLESLKK